MLIVEGFDDNDAWISLALNSMQDAYAPTFDEHELLVKTRKILNCSIPVPNGELIPEQKIVQRVIYARSPKVRHGC